MLLLCGLGARPRLDLSLETLDLLERSAAVFTDLSAGADFDWLKRLVPSLRPLRSDAEALRSARRGEAAAALRGHPMTSPAAARLSRRCRAAGVPFRSLAAVSPLGGALARAVAFAVRNWGHLGFDCRSLEDCASGKGRLSPAVSTVVYSTAPRPDWTPLSALARGSYSSRHPAWLVGGEGAERSSVAELGRVRAGVDAVILPAKSGT